MDEAEMSDFAHWSSELSFSLTKSYSWWKVISEGAQQCSAYLHDAFIVLVCHCDIVFLKIWAQQLIEESYTIHNICCMGFCMYCHMSGC